MNIKLIRSSVIYYLGNFTISIGNYLFHLLLIHLLVPAAYGEFLAYVSFLYLITIPSNTVSILVTKSIAHYYGNQDHSSINHFFYFILGKILFPVILLASFVVLFSNQLSFLLKAHPLAFVILGISIISSFLGSILRSYISAFHQFVFITVVSFLEILIRAIITILLIKLGLSATGAVVAMLVSGFISIVVIFIKLKPVIFPKHTGNFLPHITLKSSLIYSLIYSAGTLSLLSIDVLLVRFYFNPHQSGLYAGLSMLGRIIYFGVVPLSSLLLPLTASRFAKKTKTKTILHKLGASTIILGLTGLAIFSFFPNLVIKLLTGNSYLEISYLLPKFSLAMFIYALSYFLLTFLIAVNKQSANFVLLFFSLLQPLIIIFWHLSLDQVVNNNLLIQSLLLLSLLIYYKTSTKLVL